MKILVVASLSKSLINFRRALLRDLVLSGDHEVVALAPERDEAIVRDLASIGVRFRALPMARASKNPLGDLRTIASLLAAYREEKADLVLAYTQKPIIYGGIAARLTPGVRFFAMQSGLGFAFSEENTSAALRRFVAFLYRVGIRNAEAVFTFNRDDEGEMRRLGIVKDHHVVQVPGSGVDLDAFAFRPTPAGPPAFLFCARLLRDKGPFEFVEAARRVRRLHPEAQFRMLGPRDANPASVSAKEIAAWRDEKAVDYLGETDDVRPFLAAATVFVLPSFHREGLPRSILEAMAVGRAIITTDTPGCREPVTDGENGFIVPARDPEALSEAMLRYVRDPALAVRHGLKSREIAKQKYDVALVNDLVLKSMGLRPGGGIAARAARRTRPGSRLRRAFDIACGAVGLTVFSPVLIAIAGAIYLTMGRPALFRQMRAGRAGKPFRLIKFRTMTNACDAQGRLLSDAARVTRLGRFLRRMRLDELPELWNILIGEMGVVGPRPLFAHSPPNAGPSGAERLEVRPGLTGWAQVNGNSLLDDHEKLALDLWYVRNRSLLLDVRIIFKTLLVVIFGEAIDRIKLKAAHESDSRRSG